MNAEKSDIGHEPASDAATEPRRLSLIIINERPMVSSNDIADSFGKAHKDVLAAIDDLSVPQAWADWKATNFCKGSYTDTLGRTQPKYLLTRDGFALLAMGFTGERAMEFKLEYIQAFNRMESEIREKADKRTSEEIAKLTDAVMRLSKPLSNTPKEKYQVSTPPPGSLTTSQFAEFKKVRGDANLAAGEEWKKFHSGICSHFRVASVSHIPSSRFDELMAFVSSVLGMLRST